MTDPAGMADIHDIKPILKIAADWHWLIWAVGGLLLLIAAWMIWQHWRQRPRHPETAPAPPSPDAEAHLQLDRLAAAGTADGKQFYFQLSAILRHYVERRFAFPAAEMTIEELLPRMATLALDADLVRAFERFCRTAEPIKFADIAGDPGGMSHDLAFVRDFVDRTTQIDAQTGPPSQEGDCGLSAAMMGTMERKNA
jgi:hypothetical protein